MAEVEELKMVCLMWRSMLAQQHSIHEVLMQRPSLKYGNILVPRMGSLAYNFQHIMHTKLDWQRTCK